MNHHHPFNCKENKYFFMENDIQFKQNNLWVYQNCKKCPKCKWNIEKNQGCNHMVCRLCNHQFCWLCLQNYYDHKKELCSKFAAEHKNKKARLIRIAKSLVSIKNLSQMRIQFSEEEKRQEDYYFRTLENKKKYYEDSIENFRIAKEINEFLFFCSKIPCVFFPNEKDEKRMKLELDNFRSKVNSSLKMHSPNPVKILKETLINLYLKNYMSFVESKLIQLRKNKS